MLAFGSVFWIGMLDWNSLDWPTTPRLVVGFCLIFIGNGLAFSGMFQIGTKTTSGALGSLHIDGLYKYSRNPQYVGDLMIIIGWLLASASILALPAISFLILAAILAPYIEEPWLSRVYGEAYARYKANTPRFLLGI
ncbi:MAG: heavy metal resistance protein CzcN [Robiginitomaculum sp.]|nr:MAG: heavy metal resistance protein CzcN [Robiginitomaculum sp.]